MTWRTCSVAILGLCLIGGCGTSANQSAARVDSAADRLERVSEKGPVKLVVRITPAQPRLSDLVEMDVQVTAQPDVTVTPPAFGQAVGDFLVRDYSENKAAKTTSASGESSTHHFRYQLEPMHAGLHLIRSLAVEFVDHRPNSESKGETGLIESEPLEVQVTSEFGDKLPNLADLEPMLPPRPIEPSAGWGWLVACLSVVAIGLSAFWFRRRGTARAIQQPTQTPEEIAHTALEALLAENLPSRGLYKEFYIRLTDIVRHFIEGTTGLKAPEQTTEEFLRAMRSHGAFTAERSARLKEFLEAADMVKYAGQQPTHEQIELSIARAHEFIDSRPAGSVEPATTEGDG